MSCYCFNEVAGSDNFAIANLVLSAETDKYQFKRKQFPDIYIPNRGFAITLSLKGNDSDEAKSVQAQINEYNEYLNLIEAIPGFVDFFKLNGLCVSRKEVSKKWSENTADLVFSKKSCCFYTELSIIHDYLFDNSNPVLYQAIIENSAVSFPIGKPGSAYTDNINGKKAIWNWMDNGHDFCLYLWMLLGERESQDDKSIEDENAVHYDFDAYDQFRHDNVEPQLVNVFKKLETLGYIKSYTVKSEHEDPRWIDYGKTDGTIDLALVDMSFTKNKLVMEQIELLLWQRTECIKSQQYFLTDRQGKQYLSETPGFFGGHNKLKIYGRLDCSSATRSIAKGQYIQHRVFFKDEQTAKEAGYRPCAKCMPEAYKIWKETKT